MTARATLELPLPPGEPAAMRAFARLLDGLGRELAAERSALLGVRGRLDGVWDGSASTAAGASVTALAAQAATATEAMRTGSSAVGTYAGKLETARDEVHVLRRRKADADHELERGLVMAKHTETGPRDLQVASQSLHAQHRRALWALERELDAITADCERAGLVLRRALEGTRGPFVRGHRQSIDDYVGGMVSALVGTLPVLREHPDAVQALVWAAMTQAPGATIRAIKTHSLLSQYRAASKAWHAPLAQPGINPTRTPWWLRQAANRSTLVNTFLQGDNWVTGSVAMRTQSLASIYSQTGLRGLPAGAGALRGLGLVGSASSTVLSGLNVVSQGNPVDAFRENGASYVADVGETLFNGSVTAMLIAPSPVTAGAVVVTGVVYVGAELYANREKIAALATDGVRMAGDVARRGADLTVAGLDALDRGAEVLGDTVTGAVDDVKSKVDAGLGAVGDRARDIGSTLNPFD